jgi:hypothetical protein
MTSLADPRGALLKENDWISDHGIAMDRLWDMKMHPEKYAGFKCGIEAVDSKILEIQNQLQELKDRTDNARACALELLGHLNQCIQISNSSLVRTVLIHIKERVEILLRIMP